jgi:hypothetical protein
MALVPAIRGGCLAVLERLLARHFGLAAAWIGQPGSRGRHCTWRPTSSKAM